MDLPLPQKKLLRLLSPDTFCSGSFLAGRLSTSRTAVWNYIGNLRAMGIDIDAVSGRGYRLSAPLELLEEIRIRSGLMRGVDECIGTFFIHDQIGSTNDFLNGSLDRCDAAVLVCLAEAQTAGKGRSGKTWVSPFGKNIYLSLGWKYFAGPSMVSGLSLAIGVAVLRVLAAAPHSHDAGGAEVEDALQELVQRVVGVAHHQDGSAAHLGVRPHLPVLQQDLGHLETHVGFSRARRALDDGQLLGQRRANGLQLERSEFVTS